MKTTVDREKWLRGNVSTSMLRNKFGNMCCLGFRAIEGGAEKAKLVGIGAPSGLTYFTHRVLPFSPKFFRYDGVNSDICDRIMKTNDSSIIKDTIRECQLKKLFNSLGEEIEFVN